VTIIINDIKALIFDLDETLYIGEAAAIDVFMEICRLAETACGVDITKLYTAIRQESRAIWQNSPARQYCVRLGISSWEGLSSSFDGNDPNLRILREWSHDYRVNSWEIALSKCGIVDRNLGAILADAFYQRARENNNLYPDVIPCLDYLSRYYPLAILTNGTPDLQSWKITTTGIEKYFKEIVISTEVGYGKPERQAYEILLSRLDVKASDAWMIGDHLERDIRGAQAVGMKTVWVNRDRVTRDESIVPDLEVTDLKQLTEKLRKFDNGQNLIV
jgi:phosphoserine phosphatase